MNTRERLIDRIQDWCGRTGTSERALAVAATRSPNSIRRLRSGGTVTTRTIERIETHMETHVGAPKPWQGSGAHQYESADRYSVDMYSHGGDEIGYDDAS